MCLPFAYAIANVAAVVYCLLTGLTQNQDLRQFVQEVSAAWMAVVKPAKQGGIHGVFWNKLCKSNSLKSC
jgi:hypothetical protein